MTEPTPAPPPEAAGGRHSASQASGGVEAHRDRDRSAQTGSGGTLREQIETAIAELTYYERDDASLITDAVMAVRDREMERLKILAAASESPGHAVRMAADYADRAIENGKRADQLASTLGEVLREFTHNGHPGVPCLRTPWINVKTVARWRAVLHQPQPAPAPDDGPSVQECAEVDRRWFDGEKAGE